jgi:exo-rhamnogalacturonan lyase-like protein
MSRAAFVFVVALTVGCVARGAELTVPLTVTETAGVARVADPVTTGVPFAKGVLKDVNVLRLFDAKGTPVPCDLRLLSPWPDGSVRTALITFLTDVPANGKAAFTLKNSGGKRPIARGSVGMPEHGDMVQLTTGPMQITVGITKRSALIQRLVVDGKPVIESGPGAVLIMKDGEEMAFADFKPTSVRLEHEGGVAATIVAKGRVGNLHKGLLGYTARITVYAGKKIVKIRFWLENDGAFGFKWGRGQFNNKTPEWFIFDGLKLRFPLAGKGAATVKVGKQTATLGAGEELAVEQRAAGGRWKNMKYVVRRGGKELESGHHIDGRMGVSLAGGPKMNVVVRHFWQQYEKALSVKGNTVDVHLWPTFGDWPRSKGTPGLMPPRGKRPAGPRVPGKYALVGATHKSHELLLDFSGGDLAKSAATIDRPLMALAPSEYYAATEAWGTFAPNEFVPKNAKLAAATKRWRDWAWNVVDPKAKDNIHHVRQSDHFGPGYGWMDFGDLPWVCGVSNLHYDWNGTMTLNYILTGKPAFYDAAVAMNRMRTDISQVWSGRDAENFDWMCRYEKGCSDLRYPYYTSDEGSPQPQHNWLRGLVLWYWLTGDVKAREAAIVNASKGIKARLVDGLVRRPRSRGAPRASGWSILNMCAVYDLTGEKKYLDYAKVFWNNHLKRMWPEVKAGREKYQALQWYYSTEGLINLHQRTGDASILAQMKDFCEIAQDPKRWYYKPDMSMFMTNYAGYLAKCGNTDYLDDAADWLDTGAPADKRRLVLWTRRSGAYTKETGKALRNGHILLWSLWKLGK